MTSDENWWSWRTHGCEPMNAAAPHEMAEVDRALGRTQATQIDCHTTDVGGRLSIAGAVRGWRPESLSSSALYEGAAEL